MTSFNTLEFTMEQLELLKTAMHQLEDRYPTHRMYIIIPIDRYIDECIESCKRLEKDVFYFEHQKQFSFRTKCFIRDCVYIMEQLTNRRFPMPIVEPSSVDDTLQANDSVANYMDPRTNWVFFANEPIPGIRNLNTRPWLDTWTLPKKGLFDIYKEVITLVHNCQLSKRVYCWVDPVRFHRTTGVIGFLELFSKMETSYLSCFETSCIFYRTREAINATTLNRFKSSIPEGTHSTMVWPDQPPINQAASLASNVLRRASEYVW